MDTIRNVTQLFIGKDPTRGAVVDEVINVYTQLADGEVVITDPHNKVLNNATTAAEADLGFKVIQRSGTKLIHSDVVLPKKVLNYNSNPTAKETQQLDYVGFNGVAGSITGVASNIYTIRLNILDKTTAGFMQQKIKEGFYKSNAAAASYTQQRIALGLQASLVANYSRETEQDLVFQRLNGGAALAALGNITFTKGSKYITSAADDTLTMLVGSLIRAEAALTSPTYVIVGHDSGVGAARVYELDLAWQGASVAAAANAETVTEGDWGISIQGVNREFKAGYYWSNVIFWETQVDFGELAADVLVTSTAAYPGIGTGQYIANLEGELQADEFIYRGFPEAGVVNRTDGIGTTWYDVTVIEYEDTLEAAQGTPTKSPKAIMIAWDVDVNGDGTLVSNAQEADTLGLLALDQIIVTLWGIGSAQVGNVT